MSNIVLVIIGCLLLIIIGLYIAFKTVSEKLTLANLKNAEYEYTLETLENENAALLKGTKLIADNERKANEKIEALHSGDSIANAINGLSKHSGHNS